MQSRIRTADDFQEKKREDWKKIKGWAAAETGLSLSMGYLDFSKEFIERTLATGGESIDNLITRARDALK